MNQDYILKVDNLVTSFDTEFGRLRAVDQVSFTVGKGRTLGVVGESGCGKSVTALSIMRLLPKPSGVIESGEIHFHGEDIAKISTVEMRRIRGKKISMIFQEPMTALNPVHKIGKQIKEVFQLHFPEMGKQEAMQNVVRSLKDVGIPDPDKRINEYPHQISGGMRQRVMIAMALACRPDILIADEPTTALDVTIQAQILELIDRLKKEINMSVIFITHDLGVIAEICDDVLVMYAGNVVETAPVFSLFEDPKHPYTRGLLSSIPRLETPRKTRLPIIEGMVPSIQELPQGCRFQNRCPEVMEICRAQSPEMTVVGHDHSARCYLYSTPPDKEIQPLS
ncbi:MAG: peptide ABC transporter ATP-binding protein [Desulfobacterium sp.]|nr:peptide ABC transporter ATP-binding protein [Desulfobacterium sp.]